MVKGLLKFGGLGLEELARKLLTWDAMVALSFKAIERM
jgi:hypothetical protein